jgi:hypothetical protein
MNTPTNEILDRLSALGGFIKKNDKANRLLEDWKKKIRAAWISLTNQPLPKNWEDPLAGTSTEE